MMIARHQPGTPRARGHRHVGGRQGQDERERHYIAAIGITIAAIGAAVSTYSAVSAGQQRQEAADYNAKVARNQAAAAREAAAVAEADERAQTQRTILRITSSGSAPRPARGLPGTSRRAPTEDSLRSISSRARRGASRQPERPTPPARPTT